MRKGGIFRWLLALSGTLGGTAPAPAQYVQTIPRPTPQADALADAMRRLAADPRDLDALLTAAELSFRLGDSSGAAALFKRAEQVSPMNGRVKAGMASILVRAERPGEALRYFNQAEGFGLDPVRFAADRGLAYDLIGEQERAQREYRRALKANPDNETVRRYALSLGISGKREAALEEIDALVRTNDRGAWRARAFILAMNGDVAGANQIAASMIPGMALAMQPFFARLPTLGAVDRAFAVHFGEVRPTAERVADARLTPALPPLPAEPRPAPVLAAAPRVAVTPERDTRNKRGRSARRTPEQARMASAVSAAQNARRAVPGDASTSRQPPVRVASNPVPSPAASASLSGGAIHPSSAARSSPRVSAAAARAVPLQRNELWEGLPTRRRSRAAPVLGQQGGPAIAAPAPNPQTRTVAAAGPTGEAPSSSPIVASLTSADLSLGRNPSPAFELPPTPVSPAPAPTLVPSVSPTTSQAATASPMLSAAPPLARTGGATTPDAADGEAWIAGQAEEDRKALAAKNAVEAKALAAKKAAEAKALAAKKAAEAKALAAKKAADEKALSTKKAMAEEAPAAKKASADTRKAAANTKKPAAETGKGVTETRKADTADSARIWVQVAGGASERDLPKAWVAAKTKAPELSGRQAYTTPLRATNRVVTGPFKTDAEAQKFVNQLARQGVSAFVFRSSAGQVMTKLSAK